MRRNPPAGVRPRAPAFRRAAGLAWLALLAACGGREEASGAGEQGPLVVFSAGSLSRPLRAALDSFARDANVTYQLEAAGSLETARKLTELGKTPDFVALADEDVFPKMLMPSYATWYVRFARNRIVLAYTDRSRFAAEVDSTNWYAVLQRPGVEVGRSNPDLDPAGYRTVMAFQLAERQFKRPGLAAALMRAAPPRNMRPKEIDLVALLESGDLDYAWFYESMARASSVRFVQLGGAIDLGDDDRAADYATATVPIAGGQRGDTVTMRGAPIRYAFTVPLSAPHAALGVRFAAFLLGARGRSILAAQFLMPLDRPGSTGSGVPPALDSALARVP